MKDSKIEWTTHSFNPWVGCTKVSPACDHCYAENLGARLQVKWGPGQSRHHTSRAYWNEALRWNDRCAMAGTRDRVFCASLADVFDNEVPQDWRAQLWNLIESTPFLDWLILTKRIGNVPRMIPARWRGVLPSNIWLGISVVTQEEVERDVLKLVLINARVRFLSCEPLLEEIDLKGIFSMRWNSTIGGFEGYGAAINQDTMQKKRLDWVIVGGESGPHARPMNALWADKIRIQCQAAGAAFFMKQGSQHNWPAFKDFSSFPIELQVREFPQ